MHRLISMTNRAVSDLNIIFKRTQRARVELKRLYEQIISARNEQGFSVSNVVLVYKDENLEKVITFMNHLSM